MQEVPKRIKRLVREWAGIAHDRELRKALDELRVQFDRLERGDINAFEITSCASIPSGHVPGDLEEYATTHLEPAVASAVAAGVLRKGLPAELAQHIAGLIEFYESISLHREQLRTAEIALGAGRAGQARSLAGEP